MTSNENYCSYFPDYTATRQHGEIVRSRVEQGSGVCDCKVCVR